ncbi:hypothetical protein GCM10029992_29130 [Glycomyces albus]
MVATPWALAFSMTVAPVPESRLTVTRTLTPLVSIWSAMVWKSSRLPWAFWMSYSTPAASKAASRYWRSAVSHRSEEAESGRITPMKGVSSSPPEDSSAPQAVAVKVRAIAAAALSEVLRTFIGVTCFLVLRRSRPTRMFRSPHLGAGVLDRQSGPAAIAFLEDLLDPRMRGPQGDVGVSVSLQDVDRSRMIGVPHRPAVSAVKPVPGAASRTPQQGATCEV